MNLKVNTIITLDNNDKYVVLSKTLFEGVNYFLMMGIDDNKEAISSKVAIFEEETIGLDTYVKQVSDPVLMVTLTKLLKSEM